MFRRAAAAAAVLLACAAGAQAARTRASRAEDAPPWLREAAARATPEGAAGSVVLHEECLVEPLAEEGVRTTCRHVFRALSESAAEDLDEFAVSYRKNAGPAPRLEGFLLPGDGTLRRSDPKIDLVDLPHVGDAALFNDSRVIYVTMAGLRAGGVVGFESVTYDDIDLGADEYVFGEQTRATLVSRFTVQVPPGFVLETSVRRGEKLEIARGERTVTLTARDLRPLGTRELRMADRAVLPSAWVRWWAQDGRRGFPDWNAVCRFDDDLRREVLKDTGEAEALARRLAPAETGGLLRSLSRAFDFTARDVRYVAIHVGLGGWQPHSPAHVMRARYGDCKDKTTLLRALAGAWGLQTLGVAVRTRDRGPVDAAVPTPAQFDHEIAGIVLPEGVGADLWPAVTVEGVGRVLFLDATANDASMLELREDVQGTQALLCVPGGARLVGLPVQPPAAARRTIEVRARAGEDGALVDGTYTVEASGTAAARLRSYYGGLDAAARARDAAEDADVLAPGARVVESTLDGLDAYDRPVRTRLTLAGGRLGRRAGDVLLLEPGKAGSSVVRAALPVEIPGTVEIGAARSERLDVEIELPPGFVPESLPEPLVLDVPELGFEARWSFADGRLAYRRLAERRVPAVAPERWPAFRAAMRAAAAADTRPIVLVRGEAAARP